jgi:adenosylcobinamide kinase/adenosylcobinamide-phosphate guanylyltransferase
MINYITGGERSGKSRYGEELALKLSPNPVYLATARIWDDDFKKRVERHKHDRDERWENLEEEKFISRFNLTGRIILLDCITLWLTNFYADNNYDAGKSLAEAKAEFDKFINQQAEFIIISNELGMSLHAETPSGRKFVEMQGLMNQYIASKADSAILMVSGLPLKLK